MRALALLLALVLASHAWAASDPAESARLAIEALGEAEAELRAAEKASDRVAALTQTIRAYETGLEAMREGLRRATIREAAIAGVFEAERERLARLVGVLGSMSSAPAPVGLLHPEGPVAAAHAGMVVGEVVPALQSQAEELRAALEEMQVLRQLQQSAVDVLERGLRGAEEARVALSLAISERTALPPRFIADPEQLQALVNSTETLAAFADGLMSIETLPDSVPEGNIDFAARKGTLALPVLGRLLRSYNEADAAGIMRPGIILATRPRALVTLPAPATIRYIGPLLDYGQVAVVEPAEGILMVLAGMGRVYGNLGEVLPEGAPIGLMGGQEADSQAFLIEAQQLGNSGRSETLYIEIREDGSPVDPGAWFALQDMNSR